MRYVQTVLIPDGEGLQATDTELAADPAVRRERLHNINLLDDGTAVALTELSGDPERMREIAEASPDLIDSHSTVVGDRVWVYSHFVPSETGRELLSLLRDHELILDFPLEYTERGGLRSLVIGEQSAFREVMGEIPDGVTVKLERTGEYEPESNRLFSMLTERQRETLKAAVRVGYYDEPRRATHEDIAEELGRSKGTVGEHLRKIERTVFTSIVPR